jgi:hypothetical protein
MNFIKLTRTALITIFVRPKIDYASAFSRNALNVVRISIAQNTLCLNAAFLTQLCQIFLRQFKSEHSIYKKLLISSQHLSSSKWFSSLHLQTPPTQSLLPGVKSTHCCGSKQVSLKFISVETNISFACGMLLFDHLLCKHDFSSEPGTWVSEHLHFPPVHTEFSILVEHCGASSQSSFRVSRTENIF